MIRLQRLKHNQYGFALPVIMLLMALMAITAYTVLSQSSNSLSLTYRQSYKQMARVASKAAIDYAQEQFDNAACGAYNGTAETNLVSNSSYRVTMKADVLSTAGNGLSKVIQGTGSVYLPKNAVSARYVFNIESEVVNTFATCKTPADYDPLIWLDASDTNALLSQTSGTSHILTGGNGLLAGLLSPTGTALQELAANGNQTLLSWQNPNMQMSTCSVSDFIVALTCLLAANKRLYNGVVFQNVAIPQGATITSATLKLVGATPSGSGGSETNQINGLYQSASNPYTPLFSEFGNSQVKTPLTTAGRHTTASVQFTTNNLPPGNTVTVDIKTIVQEMVNKASWNSAINDGQNDFDNMGFGIQYVSGNGTRNLAKNGLSLDVTWSGGVGGSSNGSSIVQWNDESGNGNHAVFTYGTAPTRQDNQINGKAIVRFNNGALLSSLTSALSGKREMTVFAVTKPNFTTSGTDGRFISGTSSGASNDTTSGSSIIPLLRDGSLNGFSNLYSGSTGTYRQDYVCTGCNNTTGLFSSIFRTDDSTKTNSFLRQNGAQVAEKDGLNPGGSPYTYALNQFYFGGTRTGAMPGSGTAYMNGDYAELVVYDHALSCHEVVSIENYLRSKWNISGTAYTDTCPNDVPTL